MLAAERAVVVGGGEVPKYPICCDIINSARFDPGDASAVGASLKPHDRRQTVVMRAAGTRY